MADGFQRFPAVLLTIAMLFLMAGQDIASAADTSWPDPSPIAAIQVNVDDRYPNGVDWEALARAAIQVILGDDTLTRERLDKTEKILAHLFDVKTTVTPRTGGVDLTFLLKPFRRIKTIDIDGAYPLFEKDVLNVMTVSAGDIFRREQMSEQESLVAQRYKTEGYVDPKVHITWRQDHDGHYLLQVDINKGPYYVLEKVQLHGNHAMGDDDLLSRMSTFRKATFMLGEGRFEPLDLKKDVRRLIEYYRKQGFALAAITPTETFDPVRHRVQCRLVIEEGPRYTVVFEGNHYYADFRLRRDLVLFQSGNIGNIGVRRSVQKIRRRYLARGFADVKVRWQETKSTADDEQRVQIAIVIEEGLRHIVERVDIQGNAQIDAEAIRGQMLTRPPRTFTSGAYVADTLQEDLVAIRSLYFNEGFLNIQAQSSVQIEPDTTKVRVTIQIKEGPQTRVGKVSIQGRTPLPEQTLAAELHFRPGDPYVPSRLLIGENQLSARISAMGYPHVQVQSKADISEDLARADIVYDLDSGPLVSVGEIFFLGNFRTRHRLMMRELDFKTGDPFNMQKILEAQKNLRDLNIFDSVQVRTIGLKEDASRVHLIVLALEKKPYYLESAGGYKTDKGFYGRAKIGDHNFLGLGKDIALDGEVSQVGNRWEGSIADPRFLGTAVKAKAGVYSELSEPFNQDIGTTTTGANANFSYDWGRYYTNALTVKYERRQQYQRTPAVIEPDDSQSFEPRTVTVTTPSIEYDSRDSFIQPHQGVLAGLAVDISKGLENSVDDFLRYRLDLRIYHPLLSRVTLAGRLWTGYMVSYGESPAQDQLLYLGGAGTVRGFKENLLRYDENGTAVGGLLAMAAGLETRIDVGRNFELIPFVDTGSVRNAQIGNAQTDAGDDSFRWSAGLGLEYVTPIGPIGLYYGHKLDRRLGESSGQINISIGYTF